MNEKEKFITLVNFLDDYIKTLEKSKIYTSDDFARGLKIGQVGLIKTIIGLLEDK